MLARWLSEGGQVDESFVRPKTPSLFVDDSDLTAGKPNKRLSSVPINTISASELEIKRESGLRRRPSCLAHLLPTTYPPSAVSSSQAMNAHKLNREHILSLEDHVLKVSLFLFPLTALVRHSANCPVPLSPFLSFFRRPRSNSFAAPFARHSERSRKTSSPSTDLSESLRSSTEQRTERTEGGEWGRV